MPLDPLEILAARRREIQAEMARINDLFRALKTEDTELEVAERAFKRLSGSGGSPSSEVSRETAEAADAAAAIVKPEGIPTIPEMIREALEAARKLGRRGLEPKEMTEYIAQHYWADVPGVAVSPIAWRMWKVQGKLDKDGSIYILPQNTEAADLLSRAGSTASISNQHQAGKPAPGGGT